ncbi:MAG: glycosyltransferase family 4 protein [Candidatus Omnitrophota bacterium]|jgi:glycosyltransferase involved in cell wall biosynthesis
MRILQVVHSFVPDNFAGTEIYTYRLSKALQEKGHEVSVFFRKNEPEKKEYSLSSGEYDGIPTFALNHTLNKSSSFRDTYLNGHIDNAFGCLLDSLKPDIVHIQHLLFLSLGIIKQSRQRGIPVVFTINDYWLFCPKGQLLTEQLQVCAGSNQGLCVSCIRPQFFIRRHIMFFYNLLRKYSPSWLLQVIKKTYFYDMESRAEVKESFPDLIAQRLFAAEEAASKISLFIAPSEFARSVFLKKGVPVEKIITCRHGIINPSIPIEHKADKQTVRFGYVGTLLPMKGIDLLVKAFRKLSAPHARFFIYGKAKAYAGYESFYKELKKKAKGDSRICLMGSFDNAYIGKVLSSIDVLVVPSIWPENTPLIILEALASHIPVVASRIGGIPELIKEGTNGLLFEPNNIDDLKRKLELFFENPGLLSHLKQGAKALRSIEENAQDMENIYRSSFLSTEPACGIII